MTHVSAHGSRQHPVNHQARVGALEHQPILLNVEDSEASRFLRTRIFRKEGFHVIEAASASEALNAVTRQAPSVALIDVDLPDSSGITLCDTLRRLHPDVPVVVISSGAVSVETQRAALTAGAWDYIGEPVPSDTLVRCVRGALLAENDRRSDVWVATDENGFILEVSPRAARLLSGTPRGLHRRSLIIFFEQDRDAWRDAMSRACQGERVRRSGRLRPRERRPVAVRVQVARDPASAPAFLLWTFESFAD